MNLGEKIKCLRESRSISQTALANAVGTTKQQIYKYENGIITNIPSDKVEAIANVLGTTPAFLMGWDSQPPPSDNDLKAAFYGGYEGLSQDEIDELWEDAKEYANFKAAQKLKKKQ
jgi:transcriptional regulator with XRE-family HTH domain